MTSAGKTCLRIALFALAASTAAEAQRPGMGTFGRGRGPGKLTMAPGIDVPKPVNVINLMIENRATVALTDSQFIHVIAIKRELDSTNAPMFRRIDSVQRLFKPGPVFADPSPQRRDSLASAHAVVREMIADIEENIADAREKAFALLSASQLPKAEEIEDKARKAGATPQRGRS
jgi:hypothetical protein